LGAAANVAGRSASAAKTDEGCARTRTAFCKGTAVRGSTLALVAAAGLVGLSATAAQAQSQYVEAGTLYLSTATSSEVNLGALGSVTVGGQTINLPNSNIYLQGTAVPGYGGADTIIQRPQNALINPTGTLSPVSSPLSVLGVNLAGTSLLTIGGQSYGIIANVDPTPPSHVTPLGETTPVTPDVGTYTVSGTTSGGTFTADFNVDLNFYAVPAGVSSYEKGSEIFLANVDLDLSLPTADWTSTSSSGQYIVTTGTPGANSLTENVRTGLNSNYVNFFFSGTASSPAVFSGSNHIGHGVYPAPINPPVPTPVYDPPDPVPGAIPEPSTWALMLLGFAGVVVAGYRRSMTAAAVA
jgi:hypothetical protein